MVITGTGIVITLLASIGIINAFENGRVQEEQKKKIAKLEREIEDLKYNRDILDKMTNRIDSKMDKWAKKLEDKF